MDNIINDYVKVEVPLNDEWHKKTGIEHQYYYINFVTGEQYCYLTDGSYADMYTFDKSIPLDEDTRKEQRIEFASFGGIVNIEYNNERIRGLEYAEKHGIPQAKWYQNVMLESQEMIEKNKKKASMKTKIINKRHITSSNQLYPINEQLNANMFSMLSLISMRIGRGLTLAGLMNT